MDKRWDDYSKYIERQHEADLNLKDANIKAAIKSMDESIKAMNESINATNKRMDEKHDTAIQLMNAKHETATQRVEATDKRIEDKHDDTKGHIDIRSSELSKQIASLQTRFDTLMSNNGYAPEEPQDDKASAAADIEIVDTDRSKTPAAV